MFSGYGAPPRVQGKEMAQNLMVMVVVVGWWWWWGGGGGGL